MTPDAVTRNPNAGVATAAAQEKNMAVRQTGFFQETADARRWKYLIENVLRKWKDHRVEGDA